jgi:RND family efflux transporter MFP subunit
MVFFEKKSVNYTYVTYMSKSLKNHNMKNKTIALIALSLLSLVDCKKKEKEPENKLLSSDVVPVRVAPLETAILSGDIVATGLLTTENDARLAFKIGGVIDRIYVSEGQNISKGQLLATLKTGEINAQIEQTKLGYEKAKRDLQRATNLYKDSVATLEQVQNAQTGVDLAKQQVDFVSFNSKYTSIYATVGGFVTKKLSNEGEIIGAGMPLFVLNEANNKGDWLLKIGVTDAEWASIKTNERAEINFDAFPSKTFSGFVFRKAPTADPTSGAFSVDLKVNFGSEKPAMGMFGKAKIKSSVSRQMTVIPYSALLEANGAQGFVFVPNTEGGVRKAVVQIQSFDKDKVYVSGAGLAGIKEIIVTGSAFLNEKSKISIQK